MSALEAQFRQELKKLGMTYEEFGRAVGCSRGNVARDLATRGLSKASIHRVQKMANVLGMELVTFLIPRRTTEAETVILLNRPISKK